MAERTYGQFCGFARALEMIGERWALLIVRDLLIEPRRFTDFHRSLAGIPTNVLTTRLKELEGSGIVRRVVLPRAAGSIVYELTDAGRELQPVVDSIGLWGARRMDPPRAGEILTASSFATALRSTFQAEASRGLRANFEVRLGDVIAYARVDDGTVTVGTGPMGDPDLTIETGPGIRAILTGEVTPKEALKRGMARVSGDEKLFDRFGELFRI